MNFELEEYRLSFVDVDNHWLIDHTVGIGFDFIYFLSLSIVKVPLQVVVVGYFVLLAPPLLYKDNINHLAQI
jgi:hypothetical protein